MPKEELKFTGATPEAIARGTAAPADIMNTPGLGPVIGGSPISPTPTITPTQAPVISAQTLGSTQTPLTVAPKTAGTASSASSAITSQTQAQTEQNALMAEQKAKADALSGTTATQESTIRGYLDKLAGKGTAQIGAEEQAGIPKLTQELTDITNQIEAKQLAARRQIEALEKIPGITSEGLRGRSALIEKESARELADLSIIQNARNRNLSTAQSLVDRKIEIEFGDLKDRIEGEKYFYEQNRDDLSNAEQNVLNQRIKQDEREYEKGVSLEKSKGALIIEASQNQNVPLSVIQEAQRAKTESEVAKILSPYMVDPMERAIKSQQLQNSQLDNLIKRAELGDSEALKKLNITPSDKVKLSGKEATAVQKEIVGNDAFKSIQKSVDSITALKEYEKTFKQVGTTSGLTSPFDNEKLKTSYNTATLNLKEFFNLGVLNGPDLTIIQGVLGKPTEQGLPGIGNIVAGVGAKAGIENMKKQIESSIDDRYLSLRSQYGKYDSTQVGILNEIDRTYLQSKAEVNEDVRRFLQENPDISVEDAVRIINTNI